MASAREEWSAHWRVVLGVAVAYAVGYSALSSLTSLFVDAMSKDFGVSRGTISAYSALGLLGAVSAPFIGRLSDRFGVRRVAGTCFAILALIYVAMGLQDGKISTFIFLITCFGVFGVGTGGLILTRAINSWFEAGRGMALSVGLAGFSLVNLGLAPLVGQVIETWSWREGYFLLSALAACVGLPAIYFLVHERLDASAPTQVLPSSHPSAKLQNIWRNKDFLCLAGALLLMNVPSAGIGSQLAPMMTDKGLTLGQAGWLISAMTGAVLVGRLLSGWLLDRVSPIWVAAGFTLIPSFGCLLLLQDASDAFGIAAIAVALIGLQQGAELDLYAYFVARQFGLRRYASIYGVIIMLSILTMALGFVTFGQIFDRFGSYDLGLIGGLMAYPIAALLFLGVGPAMERQ